MKKKTEKRKNQTESEKAERLIKAVERDVGAAICRLYFAAEALQNSILYLTPGETIGVKALNIAECLDVCISASESLGRVSEQLKGVTMMRNG